MEIVRELGGFSMGGADQVRRAMSKKKASAMEEAKKEFLYGKTDEKGQIVVEGAVRRGIKEDVAEKIINQITIEPIHPDDYHKCSNIWNMKTQPLADKWLEEIKSGNRIVYVYKINGEFIGEGALVFDTGDPDYTIPNRRVYVSRMIVKKEYRNKGIGTEILEFLIKKAKEMGFSEMTIGVDKDNVNALHLYRKHGFDNVIYDGADENGEYFKLMKRI